MTTATQTRTRSARSRAGKRALGAAGVVVLVAAMGLSTTYVSNTGAPPVADGAFSAERYGPQTFPKIRQIVIDRAAPAPKLAQALTDDSAAAVAQYGVEGAIAPVLSVEATGTVETCESGICTLNVPDMPADQVVRVQVGPAINGTALRDGAGNIAFGDFKNQIEYQNAAAAINDAMKTEVLADLDRDALPGKSLHVVGVFQRIIPNNWLITPVVLEPGS